MVPAELSGYLFIPQAEDDLEAIWRYTASIWSPNQADLYIDTLIQTIETLVAMPKLARERTEFAPPVRIHTAAEHLIIYRIDDDWLSVIRIMGGCQNWRALLEVIDA
ncbi:toxin ParE1/3/4 [Roseinatronobacter thiooxidans]|uniref:Toxin n=1 Tax=Roseinatronobacter thiooxidans TaxID=121821 RepID=A0A2W7PKV4_9RHOB|nr:type II toxin-antitoxin system RelE/ParE family toxin [Roseinatronobacter thiooxidans]PZX36924.1 toxin ParE1/3/4 [Roseinatronobacter thiooxidans]